MAGAGNAGIVIAHHLFTLPREFLIGQIKILLYEPAQVFLNRLLVLRSWRNNSGVFDYPVIIDLPQTACQVPCSF